MAKNAGPEAKPGGGFSKTLALGGAVFLILLAIGGYILARQFLVPPPPDISGYPLPGDPRQTPAQIGEYMLSPLVSQFGISSTPVLVFNCQYKRTGTFASRELRQELPAGTERQDLINALCSLSSRAAICAYSRGDTQGALFPLRGSSPCVGDGEKFLVYAFYSPTCPNCANQRPTLESLEALFKDDLEVRYVCTPIYAGDLGYCESSVRSGAYDE